MSDHTISDSVVLANLTREMKTASERQMLAAGNIANVDTPGYRSQELTFSSALDKEITTLPLSATDARHITTSAPASSGDVTLSGDKAREDGNNVQIDHELLAMTKAAGDFSAAQTVIAAKFRLVRYAINEGK